MFKVRGRKVLLIISVFTVLFVIYQMSYSESNFGNLKEAVLTKDTEKSVYKEYEVRSQNKINVGSGKSSDLNRNFQFSLSNKSSDVSITGENSIMSDNLNSLFSGQKIVHIDLKGAPVKVSYYKAFFPLIKRFGATGLLMEYEDMFPYSSSDVSATNAYSRSDIKSILKSAAENNLEVIPLVQTFGHLEFVLKLKEYENLREVVRYPQVICPSRNGSSQLLKSMIDDIVAMHPSSRYLHIGCDEVYNLGECNQCLDTMLKNNWTKQQLFLSHVKMVARYIKEMYPTLKPLTWDDEFRKMTLQELISSEIGSLVEPVVWKYTTNIDTDLKDDLWDKYSAAFGSVWMASAFKGATGPNKFATNISHHLENHRAWMKLVDSHSDQISFKGIIITGWQRYDHFAILCELLPVGLPSLAVNLAFMAQNDNYMQSVPRLVLDILKCGPGLLQPKIGARCTFPGSVVYEKANQLDQLRDQINEMIDCNQAKGWLSDYNIRMGFSNPAHVEGATSDLDRYKMELMYLEQDMRRAMSDIYEPDTIKEWVYTFISPIHKRLQDLWDTKERLLAKSTWPRRPIESQDDEL